MEILIDERTQDGEPLGQMFLDLYREGKFAMMNPPEAIILQNKSFMALVYALAQTEQFFSAEECALIRRWLAPSYFEDDAAALADGTYIRKEIWGREGRSVSLVEKRGGGAATILEKQPDNADDIICRESRAAMYQNFIRQPRGLPDALVLHALRHALRRRRTLFPRGDCGHGGILRPAGHFAKIRKHTFLFPGFCAILFPGD